MMLEGSTTPKKPRVTEVSSTPSLILFLSPKDWEQTQTGSITWPRGHG
jgi:hypothetical protein